MFLHGLYRIVPEIDTCTGVAVNIHKARTYIQTFGVDDLTAHRNGVVSHLTVAGDLAVLNKKNSLRDQMILHNQFCVDNCKHSVPPYGFSLL